MPRGPRGEKRPADVIGAAIMVAKIATGEREEDRGKAPKRATGGRKGGKARAAALTPDHSGYAIEFMDDLRARLANRVQLTTDGHKSYLEAVEGAFGADVDYAQLVKLYGAAPEAMQGRHSPAECIGARKEGIEGNRRAQPGFDRRRPCHPLGQQPALFGRVQPHDLHRAA